MFLQYCYIFLSGKSSHIQKMTTKVETISIIQVKGFFHVQENSSLLKTKQKYITECLKQFSLVIEIYVWLWYFSITLKKC